MLVPGFEPTSCRGHWRTDEHQGNIFLQKQQQQQQQDDLNKDQGANFPATPTTPTSAPMTTTASVTKSVSVLLPSSPLPLSKVVTASLQPMTSSPAASRDKPDLESLLNNLSPKLLAAQASNSRVMAQLAGCKPVPPDSCVGLTTKTSSSMLPLTLASSSSTYLCSPPSEPLDAKSPGLLSEPCGVFLTEPLCTPDISDMEEDLMSYEMDFQSDISSIL